MRFRINHSGSANALDKDVMQTYVGAPQVPSDDRRWKIVEATARRHGREPHALIETLHTVQERSAISTRTSLRFVAAVLACLSAGVRGRRRSTTCSC